MQSVIIVLSLSIILVANCWATPEGFMTEQELNWVTPPNVIILHTVQGEAIE